MIKLSKGANKALLNARKAGWLLAGHRARTVALAEAIARVELEPGNPGGVELATVPEGAMLQALDVMGRGGISEVLRLAPSPLLSSVDRYLSGTCAPVKCQAVPKCQGQRAGRGAPPTCYPFQSDPKVKDGQIVGYLGAPTAITYQGPGGAGSLEGRYALVPLDSLITSHDPLSDFARTEGYPIHLQERDYTHEIERQKVRANANPALFRPDLLISDNADALAGPPVINRDGLVLAGNGRSMMLRLNVKSWGGEAYRRELDTRLSCSTCYGLSGLPTAGMVLVRVVVGEYDPIRVSAQLNQTFTTELSREVAAISAGQRLSPATIDLLGFLLDQLEWGEAMTAGASRIVAALRRDGLITPANQAEWLKSLHGEVREELNRSGSERLRDAVIGATIRSVEALREASPALMLLFETIAPSLLKLDTWDPENKHGYNFLPDFRACATEAIETATAGTAEVIERYGGAMLPGMVADDQLRAVLDGPPLRAALVIWLRRSYPQRNAIKRGLREYWRDIPEQYKNPSGSLWEMDPADLKAQGRDPEGLRARTLGVPTDEEIRKAGGPRKAIVRTIQAEIESKAERKAARRAESAAAVAEEQGRSPSSPPSSPSSPSSSATGEPLEGLRGQADPRCAKLDPAQVARGVAVELEHTSDPRIAAKIACDHLLERPDYYERLAEMEAQPVRPVMAEPSPAASSPAASPSSPAAAPTPPAPPAGPAPSPGGAPGAAGGWTVNPFAARVLSGLAEQQIATVLWAVQSKIPGEKVYAYTGIAPAEFLRVWGELKAAKLLNKEGSKLSREGKAAWKAIAKKAGPSPVRALWTTTQARDRTPAALYAWHDLPQGPGAFAGPAEWRYRKADYSPFSAAELEILGDPAVRSIVMPGGAVVPYALFSGPIRVVGLPFPLVLDEEGSDAVIRELARRMDLRRGAGYSARVARDELGPHRTSDERVKALFAERGGEEQQPIVGWLRFYGVPGDAADQARLVARVLGGGA